MRTSCGVFVCVECGNNMEQVPGVPVLQSLQGHLIHCCAECGQILLVQKERTPEWNTGWLTPLFMELRPPITCLAMVVDA